MKIKGKTDACEMCCGRESSYLSCLDFITDLRNPPWFLDENSGVQSVSALSGATRYEQKVYERANQLPQTECSHIDEILDAINHGRGDSGSSA